MTATYKMPKGEYIKKHARNAANSNVQGAGNNPYTVGTVSHKAWLNEYQAQLARTQPVQATSGYLP